MHIFKIFYIRQKREEFTCKTNRFMHWEKMKLYISNFTQVVCYTKLVKKKIFTSLITEFQVSLESVLKFSLPLSSTYLKKF